MRKDVFYQNAGFRLIYSYKEQSGEIEIYEDNEEFSTIRSAMYNACKYAWESGEERHETIQIMEFKKASCCIRHVCEIKIKELPR